MSIWVTMTALLMAVVLVLLWAASLNRRVRRRDEAMEKLCRALRDRQELALELTALCTGAMLDEPLVEAVALSRCHAMQARSVLAKTKCETDLCWALARLMSAAEAHDHLRDHARFAQTVEALSRAEDLAATATMIYNAEVEALDMALKGPISRTLATLFGIVPGQLFELDPKVARESMMALMGHPSRSVPSGSVAFAV